MPLFGAVIKALHIWNMFLVERVPLHEWPYYRSPARSPRLPIIGSRFRQQGIETIRCGRDRQVGMPYPSPATNRVGR